MKELKLPQNVTSLLGKFTERAKELYGEGLVSIALYGSAASGEFSSNHSNINLVVILNDTSLLNLSNIAPLLNKNRFRLLNILFFTEDYVRSSADVFPIEFLDMKENHRILYGKNVFADLKVDIGNLRFQCEQELKSKIINIKKIYLSNMKNPDLDRLLMKFFTSSLHILRNVLRLKNEQAVYKKEEILRALEAGFHVDISNMSKLLEHKNSNKRLPGKITAELFNSFVNDLEKIAAAVDGL